MDAPDIERIVVAKPVASRPSYSSLNSFSGLQSGTISNSAATSPSEAAITPIRPKTVKIKSAVATQASVTNVSSPGEVSGTAGCHSSENILNPEIKSSVVYKPLAKLVSRKTVLLLANLENFDSGHQNPVSQVQSQAQDADHSNQHLQIQLTPKRHKNHPSRMKTCQTSESSHATAQNLEDNQRAALSAISGDRPSYDGYNWRKYGQKQVKGSEYPRSYYKCTHPNCPVKKKVERSLDGEIAEIVYKGEHNHSKPQPLKRQSSLPQDQGAASDMSGHDGNLSWSTAPNVRSEAYERRLDNKYESQLSGTQSYSGKSTNLYDSIMFGSFGGVGTADYSCGFSGDCEEGSRGFYVDDDGQMIKRRKNEHTIELGILGQGAQDVTAQNSTDSEVLGDGFRWRKYGQKVVKGNPHPRSYYRCTNIKCNVRKHVERAVDDPKAFITTYEGKHNHDKPAFGNLNPVASDPDSTANKGKQ